MEVLKIPMDSGLGVLRVYGMKREFCTGMTERGDGIMEQRQIALLARTRENAEIYYYKSQDEEIRRMLPSASRTVEEALAAYDQASLPGADSFGRSIYWQGRYIGDIWCYCIDRKETPNAMLSYCVFEKEYWGRGAATAAVEHFLEQIREQFSLRSVGAFTYADNAGSIKVLEKNGFICRERFVEDGRESAYFEREL